MKAFFSCLMLITFLASQTLGNNVNNTEVPEKVSKSFQKKYPNHTEATWDDLGDLFVVNFFDEDDVLKEATFDTEGNWKETITSMDEDEMPLSISATIKKKYGEEIEFYEMVLSEKPTGKFYFINIEVTEKSDGDDEDGESQNYTLTFDSQGKFLKQE